ncbi:MAG: hypothetical protein EOO08_13770 [Chitinophagaceae bacterium]|nr:MAG: hypothetical protein EOO08_13770 [Chitinophagaceae bacterium]
MAQNLAQKLKIKEDYVLRTLHAPPHFEKTLDPLPEGVHISVRSNRFDQLHWFVTSQAELEADLPQVLALLKESVTCWIYYPKGSSKMQTDLTRDKGWDALNAEPGLQWLALISFDDTWSAFALRRKSAAAEAPAAGLKKRPIFDYIDVAKKEVRIPQDLADAFEKHPEAADYFHSLAFSHRKEYVEWIVEAKREETRASRVEGTIERLAQGWKNPRNL